MVVNFMRQSNTLLSRKKAQLPTKEQALVPR